VRRVEVREAASVHGNSNREISLSAKHRELARAKFAWAEGRIQDAYRHSFRAVSFAREELNGGGGWDGAERDYGGSRVTVDFLLSATEGVAKAELLLIRAEKVAREANVDLTKIKTEEEASRNEDERTRTGRWGTRRPSAPPDLIPLTPAQK
jgi:hypothetical protein